MKKYANLLYKIMKNKFAMKGVGKPEIYKLDHAITLRCNARCTYCEIWKNKEVELMQLSDYEKLFGEINLSWLHLTGGEPFLRQDYHQIVELADEMMDNLIIVDSPTNATFKDSIVKQCEIILKKINCQFEIGISIDGVEALHNRLRGLASGWQNCLETYEKLKKLSNEYENFGVHINHIIMPENITGFDEFVATLIKRGISLTDISIDVARNSPYFKNEHVKIDFTKERIIERLEKIIDEYGNKPRRSIRERLRLAYLKEMINFLNGKKTVICSSGWASYYLDAYGSLFPCGMMKIPIGNVRERNIKELLDSEFMKKWREKYYKCQICWSGCEGITSLIQGTPISIIK